VYSDSKESAYTLLTLVSCDIGALEGAMMDVAVSRSEDCFEVASSCAKRSALRRLTAFAGPVFKMPHLNLSCRPRPTSIVINFILLNIDSETNRDTICAFYA
jgi:hypothetical protein